MAGTMHSQFADNSSLRYRSSTNNEDLPGFNGAGLYDSKTQHPAETVKDGISKSLKQVYASMWNLRAFAERDFHRVNHTSTMMGVLVHPNYSDELANGVAVSFDPATGNTNTYYINTQMGEDLVTNPEVLSVPEEIKLSKTDIVIGYTLHIVPGSPDQSYAERVDRPRYTVLAISNHMQPGTLLMSNEQMDQLRKYLSTIHDKFADLYEVESGEQFAMEIEFKITSEDILAIKQARTWVFGNDMDTNSPPIVSAGQDHTVVKGDAVSLKGTATDREGNDLTYQWTSDYSGLVITDNDTLAPTFTAPEVDSETAITFTLTVSDGTNDGVTDQIVVTVTDNAPPTVNAGVDLTVDEGDNVTLTGTASDSDTEATLTYAWTHDSSLPITLTGDEALSTSFTAPEVDSETAITFTLTVSDGTNDGVTDQIVVTVTDNAPPTVNAGVDLTVDEGDNVTLTGTASDSDTEATLTYAWTHDSSLPITLTGDEALSTSFTAPEVDSETAITFTLTVSDGTASTADTVSVTVHDVSGSDFVTIWETSTPGESVTVPARGTYTIDWGDGTMEEDVRGSQTHTYDSPGTYTVRISDGIKKFQLNNHADAPKLTSIDQWGTAQWTAMYAAFQGASNMEYNAPDVPDLSHVTDARYMFDGASSFTGDLSGWDVSNVERMSYMFMDASLFSSDLSRWDVSSVRDMAGVFLKSSSFDSNLSTWNVSSVTDMYAMFTEATVFDSDISSWDVSHVTNMANMFTRTTSFNQSLNDWDVSNVTNMYAMFAESTSFNSDLSRWDVSQVTGMADLFNGATAFNSDISGWDIQDKTRLNNILFQAETFDRNLGKWYIVLDNNFILDGSVSGTMWNISTINPYLDGQHVTYEIGSGGDSEHFEMDGKVLRMVSFPSAQDGTYSVNIMSAGGYGTDNSRTIDVAVSDSVVLVPVSLGPREIGTVTLSSTTPGVINVDWDEPFETPQDYRVSWAKVGEKFRTWTDLSGNVFPTDSQYTITDLEDGDYKVKVRARYGGSAGDWTDKFTVAVTGS